MTLPIQVMEEVEY